jgi:hypothetical protein
MLSDVLTMIFLVLVLVILPPMIFLGGDDK